MICPNCGAENNASYQFCQRCGTRLAGQTPVNRPQQNAYQPQQGGYQPQQGGYQPQQGGYQPQQNAYQPYQGGYQPQQNAPANKPGKKLQLPGKFKNIDLKKLLPKEPKKLIIPGVIGAVVLVAVIVLICVLSAGGGSGFGGREINYYTFYNPTEDEEMALYANGELVEEGLEFEDDIRLTSLDGEVLCMLTNEGEVYVARDGELSLLTDEIEMVAMSVDGSTVACVNEDQELVLFDTKKLEETFVAEEAYFPVLSPDGKSVAYTCADEEGEEIMLFYFDGKKSVELGKDMVAISVSNGGKYIYAYNGEKDAVYTMDSKGESAKLCAGLDDGVTVLLNADHTQIILRADGKWYASEKGGEKIKLSSKVTNFGIVEPIHGDSSAQESFLNVRTMALEDLSGHFYMGDNTLYYLTGKWECEKVESNVDGDYVTVTLDGKTAFYMEDGENLFKVTAKKLDEPVEVAEEIEDYVITPDGSAVYFLDEDSTLFYQKGNKDPKRIGDDVDNLYMTHDGYCLFMTDYSNYAGDVYASHNGSKKELVQSDVYRVYTLSNVTYLALDYDKDEYAFSMDYATKGIKFQFMFEP